MPNRFPDFDPAENENQFGAGCDAPLPQKIPCDSIRCFAQRDPRCGDTMAPPTALADSRVSKAFPHVGLREQAGPAVRSIDSSSARKFFEGNVERGVVLPTLPIEMPPFVGIGLESVAGHHGLEFPAVFALLLGAA